MKEGFAGVVLAASAGGPVALIEVVRALSPPFPAAVLVVQHGPGWMLEALAARLGRESGLAAKVAAEGDAARPGTLLVAPGGRHLRVAVGTLAAVLDDGPKENHVRPAADPLLRSVARAFGVRAIGVVMTGMGRDGAGGLAEVAISGGRAFVQSPHDAHAPSMPRAALEAVPGARTLPLADLGPAVAEAARGVARGPSISGSRSHSRSPVRVDAVVLPEGGGEVRGRTRDLALRGVFVATSERLAAGATCRVVLSSEEAGDGLSLRLAARVVRSDATGAALEFLAIDIEDLEHLRALVLLNAPDPDRALSEF